MENDKEMKEFGEIVKELLEARTWKEVRLDKMEKNNGVVYDTIGIVDGDTNVMPVIYLAPLL